jgi:hypothetical protein
MQYWPEKGEIIHSLRTALVTPEGRLFKLYRGSEWKSADILADLEALRGQATADQPRPGKIAAKTYSGVGVVEEIDRQMATVQINHEDIKDFMPAMSMPFAVRDKRLSMRPGPATGCSSRSTPMLRAWCWLR